MDFVKSLNMFHHDAKEIPCLTEKGAPTEQTAGAPGVLYMDTDTGELYKCTAADYVGQVFSWKPVLDSDNSRNVDIDMLGEVANITTGSGSVTIPKETILLDDAMRVGAVYNSNGLNVTKTDYMCTEKITLNATKSFQLTGVNLKGITVHPEIRYLTAYDADGNYLEDHKMENIAQASVSEGRTITMDDAVASVIISIYKATDYTNKTVTLLGMEIENTTAIPEETIALDDAMMVGKVQQQGTVDEADTNYMHTDRIKLNATKSFQLTGVNLKGITVHPELRYVTAYDADGNVLTDYSQQSIAEVVAPEGRTITMDNAVDSVVISIYKAGDYTEKTLVLLGQEGTEPDVESVQVVTLKTEKLSGFETVLSADEVCCGTHMGGVANFTDGLSKRNVCTKGYIKPFVKSLTVISNEYQTCVVVFKHGAYIQSSSFLTNGMSYTFDHDTYQYKLYINRVDGAYLQDFDAARESVRLTVSAPDVLYEYNALTSARDAERERMGKAMEYMMRRNYDVSYANAPEPNGLVSYVGNNQIVHPKVLYFPDKFGGHHYWMAYTPFPWNDDDYENPCIAYSDDGYEWTNIEGNPLDDPGGVGYNSDTHLVYNESAGVLEVWYRYVGDYETTPVPEIIYRQTTADGVKWTAKEAVINNDSGDYVRHLSPCILHDGTVYKYWAVNDTDKTIDYYEGADATALTKVRSISLTYQHGETAYTLWHIDVIEDNGLTVLLAMCKNGTDWPLFLATSEDNTTFTTPELVMKGNPYGWDQQLYRSSIVNVDGEYRIYYSALDSTNKKHGLGICTSNKLSEFVGKW